MKKKLARAIIICLAILTMGAVAGAGDKRIEGTYALNGTRVCVQNSSGFNEDLRPLSNSSTRSGQFSGMLSVDEDGSGVMEGILHQINHQSSHPISISPWSCEVSVVQYDKINFDLHVLGCESSVSAGAGFGPLYRTGFRHSTGVIADDGETLLVSDVDPNIETLEVWVDGANVANLKRICNRSTTMVKIDDPD